MFCDMIDQIIDFNKSFVEQDLAYISAEITNSKGELCNEGEAI